MIFLDKGQGPAQTPQGQPSAPTNHHVSEPITIPPPSSPSGPVPTTPLVWPKAELVQTPLHPFHFPPTLMGAEV